MPRLTLLASALAAITWLAGCASLAPDYATPVAPIPQQWPVADASGAAQDRPFAEIGWQDHFTDAHLRELITLALAHNRDLRMAGLNIEKARAQYQIQRADLFPTVAATVAGQGQRTPASLSTTGQAMTTHQYRAGLGFAAYELDVLGRIRSLRDQALNLFVATEEARRSVQISLVAEVAQAYLTLVADGEHLTLAEATLTSQQRAHELVQRRLALGSASELDLRQAQTSVENARVEVARYQGLLAQDRNALPLLVGTALPDAWAPPPALGQVAVLANVPAGLPASVLQRRPDVLQAERQLQAANANIGAARAAFFPSITLTAQGGVASNELSQLFKAGAGSWSFSPQINLPIFDSGRINAQLKVAETERDLALAQYEKTVQMAFREAADALTLRAPLDGQQAAQQALVDATAASLRLSQARFDKGLDSYLAVLDAQRTHYAAQQGLISVRQAALANQITLYKVLGGGASADDLPALPQ